MPFIPNSDPPTCSPSSSISSGKYPWNSATNWTQYPRPNQRWSVSAFCLNVRTSLTLEQSELLFIKIIYIQFLNLTILFFLFLPLQYRYNYFTFQFHSMQSPRRKLSPSRRRTPSNESNKNINEAKVLAKKILQTYDKDRNGVIDEN